MNAVLSPTPGRTPAIRGLRRLTTRLAGLAAFCLASVASAGEADLLLPDLNSVSFLGGTSGRNLLLGGLLICALGWAFGVYQLMRLRNLPVHAAMREISELIYETCKTYLITQGKFILILEVLIGRHHGRLLRRAAAPGPRRSWPSSSSSAWSASPAATAWPGSASGSTPSPTAGRPSPASAASPSHCYAIPLRAGMSIGMVLISVELFMMLLILLFIPADFAGPCFIGFAIGESLGASALRIAGGIFTKIADIGSDLMKIVFKIKEDDARNPGVIADCTGDNAGDSVGPTADGFETYGVTGVALITFILLAVHDPAVQVQLLVWIFVMRIVMVIASVLSYIVNEFVQKAQYGNADKMNFEHPLTALVWLTSIVSVVHDLRRLLRCSSRRWATARFWWKLSTIITCGTLAGAHHPRAGQGLHLHRVGARTRGRDRLPRGRRLAQHPLRPGGGQLQRLLDGPGHRGPDGHRLRRQHRPAWGRCSPSSAAPSTRAPCSPSAWWPSASSAWARSPSPWTATAR